MKRPDWKALVPPGMDPKRELGWLLRGGAAALLWALSFIFRYLNARGELFYTTRSGARILLDGAVMADFREVLGGSLTGFALLALCAAGVAVTHYMSHRRGSRSFYLMRRLPDRFEYHRRCLALPLLGIVSCAVAAFVLLALFYWAYLLFTPEGCLAPGQWQKLWQWF